MVKSFSPATLMMRALILINIAVDNKAVHTQSKHDNPLPIFR